MKETLTTIEKALFLKELSYFEHVPIEQAAAVAGVAHEVHYDAGAVVIEQGKSADHVFLTIEGSVIIERDGIVLNVVGAGDGFGDLSLVPGAQYSLSARAATHLHVLRINTDDLTESMLEHPEVAVGVVRALASRLRDLSQQLVDLNRQLQDGSHAYRLPESSG